MKRGFTLIELLAVIVILAIISLIATPIVLNIIDDTKEETLRMSADNYLDAIELSIAKHTLNDNTEKISGNFQIIENGKKIKSLDTGKEIKVEFDGEGLTTGTIVVENGSIKRIVYTKIGNKNIELKEGKLVFNNDEYEKNTLVKGQDFNAKIKLLLNSGT